MDPRPIGVFDSGMGGLTVLHECLVTMPHEDFLYLGDLAPRGAEPQINLDLAKHNVDLLAVIEEKTKGNLTDDEKRLLDAALYETRMRYVAVASQYATV